MENERIRIIWTGPDQYTTELTSGSLLTKGEVYEVLPSVAAPWIRDGWAKEAEPPRAKKSKASDNKE